MNQNNNSEKYLAKNKDPYLKIRYAKGFGDVIACFLHSKPIGWLTKIITGKDKPCTTCSKRANALNVLFPIKVWMLFFKSEEEYIQNLKEDLEKAGYEVAVSPQNKGVSSTKIERKPLTTNYTFQTFKPEEKIETKFKLLASSDNYVGDLLIKTQVFKTK
jgi:hypothetical protein